MEGGETKSWLRDLRFRLRRTRDPNAAGATQVETARRAVLTARARSERDIARFEALCEQVRRETVRIRSARPVLEEGAQPPDAATIEALRQEAMAGIEELERKLAKQHLQEHANADEWRRRAELAVHAGDDELAREALARAREHEAVGGHFQRELDAGRRVAAELRAALVATESIPADQAVESEKPS